MYLWSCLSPDSVASSRVQDLSDMVEILIWRKEVVPLGPWIMPSLPLPLSAIPAALPTTAPCITQPLTVCPQEFRKGASWEKRAESAGHPEDCFLGHVPPVPMQKEDWAFTLSPRKEPSPSVLTVHIQARRETEYVGLGSRFPKLTDLGHQVCWCGNQASRVILWLSVAPAKLHLLFLGSLRLESFGDYWGCESDRSHSFTPVKGGLRAIWVDWGMVYDLYIVPFLGNRRWKQPVGIHLCGLCCPSWLAQFLKLLTGSLVIPTPRVLGLNLMLVDSWDVSCLFLHLEPWIMRPESPVFWNGSTAPVPRTSCQFGYKPSQMKWATTQQTSAMTICGLGWPYPTPVLCRNWRICFALINVFVSIWRDWERDHRWVTRNDSK